MKNVEKFLKTLDEEEKKHLMGLLEEDLESPAEEKEEEITGEEEKEPVHKGKFQKVAKPEYM